MLAKIKFISILSLSLIFNFCINSSVALELGENDPVNYEEQPVQGSSSFETLFTESLLLDEKQETDGSSADDFQMQHIFVTLGRTLDYCDDKIEDSALISKRLISNFIKNLASNKSLDNINDIIGETDEINEEKSLPFAPIDSTTTNSIHTGYHAVWQSLNRILFDLKDACDDLPATIAAVNIPKYDNTETNARPSPRQMHGVFEQIIAAMARWTQTWTEQLRGDSSVFIDTCLTVPECASNLKLMIEIFGQTVETVKKPKVSLRQSINLQAILTSTFWDNLGTNNHILSPNETPGVTEVNESLRAKVLKFSEILRYFVGISDTLDEEYIIALGVSPTSSEDDAMPGSSSAWSSGRNDDATSRMLAAAVNVLRFPWNSLRLDEYDPLNPRLQDHQPSHPHPWYHQAPTFSKNQRSYHEPWRPLTVDQYSDNQRQNPSMLRVGSVLHEVPPHFLSLALESKRITTLDTGSPVLRNLLEPLSPAMLRLGGSSANFLTFDPDGEVVEPNVSPDYKLTLSEASHNSQNIEHNPHLRNERSVIDYRSIKAHPKFRNHENEVANIADTAHRKLVPLPHRVGVATHPKLLHHHEATDCSQSPKFHNFTVGRVELSGLLSLISTLNWTLLFDLNQFLREPNGDWDPSNARLIIAAARESGASVVWQVGNEPNNYPHKFNFSISGAGMAADVADLRQLLCDSGVWRPQWGRGCSDVVVGPDVTRPMPHEGEEEEEVGRDSVKFLREFLSTHPGEVDAVTWHQYYLCGRTATSSQFRSPAVLQLLQQQLQAVLQVRDQLAPRTPVWITETGSAYGGGAPGLSDRFVGSFLWLDKLGVAAAQGVSVVARQSLLGKDYALLGPDLRPNPDYWVSVLHKRLTGARVFNVTVEDAPDTLRLYAHCSRRGAGVIVFGLNTAARAVSVALQEGEGAPLLQWLLTPARGDLTARDVLLNGHPLRVAADGTLPALPPLPLPPGPVLIPGNSLAFWLLPDPRQECV